MKNSSVLISVLNYNNFKVTKNCINSILSNLKEDFKLLIIDNNSNDGSYSLLCKEFPNILCKKSKKNGGYAFGHSISVDYAIKNQFDFIWILNNDLTIRKNTLKKLLNAAQKCGPGLYGSITLKSEAPDVVNFGGGKTGNTSLPFDYNSFENFPLEKYLKETTLRTVQAIEGSSFLIPVDVIKEHGFMKKDFFMYGEETDYCYKLNKIGIKSYVVPGSIVLHKGAESLKGSIHLVRYYRRRNFLFFEKTHYKKSIIKNISKTTGLISIMKFFILFYFRKWPKDELYYINLANVHAIINKKGKLN